MSVITVVMIVHTAAFALLPNSPVTAPSPVIKALSKARQCRVSSSAMAWRGVAWRECQASQWCPCGAIHHTTPEAPQPPPPLRHTPQCLADAPPRRRYLCTINKHDHNRNSYTPTPCRHPRRRLLQGTSAAQGGCHVTVTVSPGGASHHTHCHHSQHTATKARLPHH